MVFWRFQRVSKWNIGLKWINKSKVSANHDVGFTISNEFISNKFDCQHKRNHFLLYKKRWNISHKNAQITKRILETLNHFQENLIYLLKERGDLHTLWKCHIRKRYQLALLATFLRKIFLVYCFNSPLSRCKII